MSIKEALPGERRIATHLVNKALERGYSIAVHDEEGEQLKASSDKKAIMDALALTDMNSLVLYRDGARVGSILLVWGNDEDLVTDNSDNDETCCLVEAACGLHP